MGASRSGDALKVSPRLKEVLDTHSGRVALSRGHKLIRSRNSAPDPHRDRAEMPCCPASESRHTMSNVSFIGIGGMARAIATRAVAGGNSVELLGRDAAKATALAAELGGGATVGTSGAIPAGDIVVLAVPYASAVAVVTQYGDALAGKVIID